MTFYLKHSSKILCDFDDITSYRLINMFYVTIGLCLLTPSIAQLKGELLTAWIISMFMLFEQLTVKFNRILVTKFTISQLYKCGNIIHILYTFGVLLYWYNPLVMLIWDMTLALAIMGLFNSYGIKLTTYLSDNYPQTMNEFQIVRNSISADAFMIGLGLSTLIAYFGGIELSLIAFFIYNSLFTIHLFKNWNYFDKIIGKH